MTLPSDEEIGEALELAAGLKIEVGCSIDRRRTAGPYATASTRRAILLFLECLDPELTVAELRECLDE